MEVAKGLVMWYRLGLSWLGEGHLQPAAVAGRRFAQVAGWELWGCFLCAVYTAWT